MQGSCSLPAPAVLPPCCSVKPSHCTPHPIHSICPGPNGEQWCWWQCTVKGGREGRDVDAVQLAQVRQGSSCVANEV